MSEIQYDGLAIPTAYRGRMYRSRLEAKWAAFFERLGWEHEYEPVDFGIWSPDFAIKTFGGPVFIEVKPVMEPHDETLERMATVPGEHILVGMAPFRPEWDGGTGNGACLGWFASKETEDPADWHSPNGYPVCITTSGTPFGYACLTNSYRDRISDYYDGSVDEAMWADVQPMWADACNAVQYRPRRRSRRRVPA